MYKYIYIYIQAVPLFKSLPGTLPARSLPALPAAPNLPTNIVDFRGFFSSIILCLRGGVLMSTGDFPESLSRAMLVGTMLVGGLGVRPPVGGQSVRATPAAGRTARGQEYIYIYIYIYIVDRERERERLSYS